MPKFRTYNHTPYRKTDYSRNIPQHVEHVPTKPQRNWRFQFWSDIKARVLHNRGTHWWAWSSVMSNRIFCEDVRRCHIMAWHVWRIQYCIRGVIWDRQWRNVEFLNGDSTMSVKGSAKMIGGFSLESKGCLLDIPAGSGGITGASVHLVGHSGSSRSGGSVIAICYSSMNTHGSKSCLHRLVWYDTHCALLEKSPCCASFFIFITKEPTELDGTLSQSYEDNCCISEDTIHKIREGSNILWRY